LFKRGRSTGGCINFEFHSRTVFTLSLLF
jgi:hypothetical protein